MPLTLDFTNKLVLVTGGGRGIGWAITNSLAKGERCPASEHLSTGWQVESGSPLLLLMILSLTSSRRRCRHYVHVFQPLRGRQEAIC